MLHHKIDVLEDKSLAEPRMDPLRHDFSGFAVNRVKSTCGGETGSAALGRVIGQRHRWSLSSVDVEGG